MRTLHVNKTDDENRSSMASSEIGVAVEESSTVSSPTHCILVCAQVVSKSGAHAHICRAS